MHSFSDADSAAPHSTSFLSSSSPALVPLQPNHAAGCTVPGLLHAKSKPAMLSHRADAGSKHRGAQSNHYHESEGSALEVLQPSRVQAEQGSSAPSASVLSPDRSQCTSCSLHSQQRILSDQGAGLQEESACGVHSRTRLHGAGHELVLWPDTGHT